MMRMMVVMTMEEAEVEGVVFRKMEAVGGR